MGQAKRRKQQLGDLYGTPDGSNRSPAVEFREMTPDEIETIDPEKLAGLRREWGGPICCVMACCAGETVPMLAAPVIDEAGQFNSYAVVLKPQGWLMRDWKVRHRDLNRYLLELNSSPRWAESEPAGSYPSYRWHSATYQQFLREQPVA